MEFKIKNSLNQTVFDATNKIKNEKIKKKINKIFDLYQTHNIKFAKNNIIKIITNGNKNLIF